jgi:hypothetical protein
MKNTIRLVLLVLPLLACNRLQHDQSGLTRKQFIDLYVKLRQAQVKAQSAEEFDRMKQQIFQQAGVNPESLQRYVKANIEDITVLADSWDTISNRLTAARDTFRASPAAADSVRAITALAVSARADTARADTARADSTRADSARARRARARAARAAARAKAARADTARADTVRTDTTRAAR